MVTIRKVLLSFLLLAVALPFNSPAHAQTQLDSRVAWCYNEVDAQLANSREYSDLLKKRDKPSLSEKTPRTPEELKEALIDRSRDEWISAAEEQIKTMELLLRRYQRFLMMRKEQTRSSEAFLSNLITAKASQREDSERLRSCDDRLQCLQKATEILKIRPDLAPSSSPRSASATTFEDTYKTCLTQCGIAVVSIYLRKVSCLDPVWLQ